MPATPGNALNVTSAGVVSFDGTATFTESSLTQHSVLVGGASQAITSISVGGNNTVLQGTASSDPAFTATPTLTSVTFGSGTALSVYQEGTWTPALVGGTPTYSNPVNGVYTRIGRQVTCTFLMQLSANASPSGNTSITGLPFTIKNSVANPIGTLLVDGVAWVASTTSLAVVGTVNSTTLVPNTAGSSHALASIAAATGAQDWYGTITYFI